LRIIVGHSGASPALCGTSVAGHVNAIDSMPAVDTFTLRVIVRPSAVA
jgi:hypothetical protein